MCSHYGFEHCNSDGFVDQFDIDQLDQVETPRLNVDHSKSAEVILETTAETVEYLDLTDQTPEINVEPENAPRCIQHASGYCVQTER